MRPVHLVAFVAVASGCSQDEADCEVAEQTARLADWQAYVAKHPDGSCVSQARAAIEELEDEATCERARAASTEESWRAYLTERPQGSCKEEAGLRWAEFEAKRQAAAIAQSQDVEQPGGGLRWHRCRVGERWTGEKCDGDAKRMRWDKAVKACPDGYRVPTRQEYMSLLGGCENKVKQGEGGECDACAKRKKCRAMFGRDTRYYWSSSKASASQAWYINFLGNIYKYEKTDAAHVRCVRAR